MAIVAKCNSYGKQELQFDGVKHENSSDNENYVTNHTSYWKLLFFFLLFGVKESELMNTLSHAAGVVLQLPLICTCWNT